MSEENGKCECSGRCKCRRVVGIVILAVVLAGVAYGVTTQRKANARAQAAAAEAARVEAILQKPLLEWTEAERAEFAQDYESRRQAERVNDKRLWTAEEKKHEWWSYSKLVVRQSVRELRNRKSKR